MASLRDDVFSQRGLTRSTAQALGAPFFVLVFVAICLLLLSRLRSDVVLQLETEMAEAAVPVLEAAARPLQPIRTLALKLNRALELQDEISQLRAENDRLKLATARTAELERRIEQLERLTLAVPDPKTSVVVARAVTPATGPFGRIALLNAGRDRGIRNGHAVVEASGLVGRIVASSQRASRVVLVSDAASRIPVSIGRRETRAIASGDNTGLLRLTLVPGDTRLNVGEEVVTSGVGGLLPRGLRVGIVVEAGDEIRVRPFVDGALIDYVSVLIYDNPALDLADDELKSARRHQNTRTRDTASTVGGR